MIYPLIPLAVLIAVVNMALIRRHGIRQARAAKLRWVAGKPAAPVISLLDEGILLKQVLVGAVLGVIGLAIWP
jgi:hypothetical protein